MAAAYLYIYNSNGAAFLFKYSYNNYPVTKVNLLPRNYFAYPSKAVKLTRPDFQRNEIGKNPSFIFALDQEQVELLIVSIK